jgi:hypothetical protein
MIHIAAQSLLFLACLAAWVYRRPLVHFVTVECSHCEGWIRQDEMATEARAWLACMEPCRVG